MSLTPKQSLFIQEYLKNFNATKAAIAAGYSEKTARQIGSENLSKPYIAEIIKIEVEARSVGTYERLEILSSIARDGEDTHKIKAVELLGKLSGDYIDRKQHEHLTPIPIQYVKENRGED